MHSNKNNYTMLLFPTECIVTWNRDNTSAHFATFFEDGEVAKEWTVDSATAKKLIAECPLPLYQCEY